MRLIGIANGKAQRLRFVKESWSFEFISGSRSNGELVRNTNRTLISYRALTVLVLALA